MFNFKKIATAMVVSATVMASSANASLVSLDWQVQGDNLSTLHEETGIEWLDFTQTEGQSYNQLMARMATGDLQGWRWAKRVEVLNLLQYTFPEAGLTATDYYYGPVNLTNAQLFSGLFENDINNVRTHGVYVNDEQSTLGGSEFLMSGRYNDWVEHLYQPAIEHDWSNLAYGWYVVNDGGVTLSSINNPMLNVNNPNAPETASVPVGLGLGALMMGGLFGLSRRKIK